ncbi:hypothetical protein JYU34_015145 [Plutella xylostella]|uniref:Uncharacterized protein n=1 Tax=Plutella xylostella TaxID=51655 RepID=A0ABQ7Q7T8_PLUXY|nr:hypothetical protein JYU34_015145 [Plutella xylostella]
METRFSDMEDRLIQVEAKLSSIPKLQKQLDVANDEINTLKSENNNRDQYSRMNNLEISGVPYYKGENLFSIFKSICLKIGIEMSDSDIDTIHRVRRFDSGTTVGDNSTGTRNRAPAIIVRFTRRMRKDEVLSGVRARRGLSTADLGLPGAPANLYIGDHLTPTNKQLLKQARELKARDRSSAGGGARRGGGTVLALRRDLRVRRRDEWCAPDLEELWLSVDLGAATTAAARPTRPNSASAHFSLLTKQLNIT